MPAVREQILDALVDALALIGTTSSYSATQPPHVTRAKHPSVSLPGMPFIYVGGVRETYNRVAEVSTSNIYDKTLEVEIEYHFESQNMDQDASRAVRDVEYALRDWLLGGAAWDIELQENVVAFSTESEPVVMVSFRLDCHYRVLDTDPDNKV